MAHNPHSHGYDRKDNEHDPKSQQAAMAIVGERIIIRDGRCCRHIRNLKESQPEKRCEVDED